MESQPNTTPTPIEKFFISMILIICSYHMDIGKNHKFQLTNTIINACLKKSKVDDQILEYINTNLKNYDLNGYVNYYTNQADTECMCVKTTDKIYLVFCGTQIGYGSPSSALKDLYSDIVLGLKPISFIQNQNVKIHNKYQTNMLNDNLVKKICKKVMKNYKTHQIIVCGHSLGCGVGLYTTLYLEHKLNTNATIEFISIDAPKIGNELLGKYISKNKYIKQYDMINNNDVVPNYPLFYPSYTHVSQNNDVYLIKPDESYSVVKCDNVVGVLVKSHSVSDHYCLNILRNLYNQILIEHRDW